MASPYQFRGSDGPSRRPKEFTFRSRQTRTFTRPLLISQRERTPEYLGAEHDAENKPKFLNLESLTDSEEEEMDVSSADDGQPPRKRQAVDVQPTMPKWSNPDPYTVLPPTDDSQGKKKDFVKLIRKAKIAANQERLDTNNAIASNEDFISLGAGDLVIDQPSRFESRGPRDGRSGDSALGNRKRNRNDEIVGPSIDQGTIDMHFNLDGSIIQSYRILPSQDPCPWLNRYRLPFHLGTMFQNEIIDFYHWVKPKPFEDVIRTDLITRLEVHMQHRFPGVQLHAFGSYASGAYLPVADVDLVLLSRSFVRSGKKFLCQKPRDIWSLSAYIRDTEMAIPGSIETIAHARVPIIKFVDRLTGLKVDLSFDNNSGLAANRTFQTWKTQFPAMPLIVSVIKQFLLLRGLNEVPTGGLGGFSIICLVTSLLQHSPHGKSDSNLGEVLMDFLDFYGTKFDFANVGIDLNPPSYFHKHTRKIYQANSRDRLTIIDPNNCDNDISGGSKEIRKIFQSFAEAFDLLRKSISAAWHSPPSNGSFLALIIGANYESYESQRERLFELYANNPRFVRYYKDCPPLIHHSYESPIIPPIPVEPPPPPPPPTSAPTLGGPKRPKKQQKLFDRAANFKILRPDLKNIPKSLTMEQAIKIGGYSNEAHMARDLASREKAKAKENKG